MNEEVNLGEKINGTTTVFTNEPDRNAKISRKFL